MYTRGALLEAGQMLMLFPNDSKSFVDQPLLADPETVLADFAALGPNVTRAQMQAFAKTHFAPPGSDLEVCEPADWVPSPPLLAAIRNTTLRNWALSLNAIWKELCRRPQASVFANPERHSLLVTEHNLIGGWL